VTESLRPAARSLTCSARRGQALTEMTLLVASLIGAGGAFVFFFPDSLNALQIYMDSFYFVLSMPIP